MHLKRLTIRHFRNINELVYEPNQFINFIVGDNGQGKTTLLECIYVLATLRSFRPGTSADFVSLGKTQASVTGSITSTNPSGQSQSSQLKIHLVGKKKTAWVDDFLIRSSSEYYQKKYNSKSQGFHAVVFNPNDHEIIRGEPKNRRDYLDSAISALDPEYFDLLRKYSKTMAQRNFNLKSYQFNFDVDRVYIEQLSKTGAELVKRRTVWIKETQKILDEVLPELGFIEGQIQVRYASQWIEDLLDNPEFTRQNGGASIEQIKEKLSQILIQNFQRSREIGSTTDGPHRDDCHFLIHGGKLKNLGSQGETRSVLLALKISELIHYFEKTGKLPIFLLDDFSSELDEKKRRSLLKYLTNMKIQSFVTTTDDSLLLESEMKNRIRFNDGHIYVDGSLGESL